MDLLRNGAHQQILQVRAVERSKCMRVVFLQVGTFLKSHRIISHELRVLR